MISMPDDGEMENYPSETADTSTDTEERTPETIDEEEAEESANTILAPKSALGDMTKVGDKCMMRVVADHGDEVELEYSSADKKKSKEMTSDEEIDAMDKGGY